MTKYITFGNWNKNYIYIIASIISNLIYDALGGLGYLFYSINIGYDKFGAHTYIHRLFNYLLILIFSSLFLLYETKINKNAVKTDEITNMNAIKLIHHNIYFYSSKEISVPFIFLTVFLYVFLEFIDQIAKQFFSFGDFWMIELLIMAYLCMKMLKIKIYNHQIISIYLVSLPLIFKIATIVLLFCDENNHFRNGEINYKYNDKTTLSKSLFVAHWWLFPISFILFFIIMVINSYIFINIKKIIDLKYISISKILILYGFFGSILSALFLSVSTFISCGKKNDDIYDIWVYQCFVVDNNDNRFFDSYKVYFSKDIGKDLLFSLLRGIPIFLHRFFFWKYIQNLSPIFKSFSYPLVFVLEKLIVIYQINTNEPINYLNARFFLDFSSDLTAFIGFLIYLEIIELNFCGLNINLRKYIIERSINDNDSKEDIYMEMDAASISDDEDDVKDNENDNDKMKE